MKVIRRLVHVEAGPPGELCAGRSGVARRGVDAGPDGRSAKRHGDELVLSRSTAADRLLDLAGVPAELLAEPDRRRVLEVGATCLHDRPELLSFGVERRPEDLERGDEVFL